MNPDTTQKQLDTFIEPAPKAGALNLRPFSPGTLTLCRKLGLSMIVGAPDVVQTSEERRIMVDALSEGEKQRQITTFLFVQSCPLDVVLRAVKNAAKDRETFENDFILPFELSLTMEDYIEGVEQIAIGIEATAAAQFEAQPKDNTPGAKETPPPNS